MCSAGQIFGVRSNGFKMFNCFCLVPSIFLIELSQKNVVLCFFVHEPQTPNPKKKLYFDEFRV